MKYFKKILFTLALGLVTFSGVFAFNNHKNVNAANNIKPVYDLSEWQHQISDNQAQQLKNESSFVILRVQYGGNYPDRTFSRNAAMMEKYGIPYGAYSYSLYANNAQAVEEAQNLYHRAPNARFYVNDLEKNNMNQNNLNDATVAWSNTIKNMSNKPTVLYSGQYFMNDNINDNTRNAYDAIWLANYSKYEPNPSYHYDLWQFTSGHHSNALGQAVDASIIPQGGKPLSFWIGNNTRNNKSRINNHIYYSSKKVTQLRVKSHGGINIYDSNGNKISHVKYNTVISVDHYKYFKTMTKAVTPNGNIFTSNKKLVKWAR